VGKSFTLQSNFFQRTVLSVISAEKLKSWGEAIQKSLQLVDKTQTEF